MQENGLKVSTWRGHLICSCVILISSFCVCVCVCPSWVWFHEIQSGLQFIAARVEVVCRWQWRLLCLPLFVVALRALCLGLKEDNVDCHLIGNDIHMIYQKYTILPSSSPKLCLSIKSFSVLVCLSTTQVKKWLRWRHVDTVSWVILSFLSMPYDEVVIIILRVFGR